MSDSERKGFIFATKKKKRRKRKKWVQEFFCKQEKQGAFNNLNTKNEIGQ